LGGDGRSDPGSEWSGRIGSGALSSQEEAVKPVGKQRKTTLLPNGNPAKSVAISAPAIHAWSGCHSRTIATQFQFGFRNVKAIVRLAKWKREVQDGTAQVTLKDFARIPEFPRALLTVQPRKNGMGHCV